MAATHNSTEDALYEAITKEIGNISRITSVGGRAVALRELALAFRFASGGPQPGGQS